MIDHRRLLRQLLRQHCPSHCGKHHGFFDWLVGIARHPQCFLVRAAIGGGDFNLISIKRPGRHSHFFHARNFQLHQLYGLLLHVKVPEGSAIAFGQRQAGNRLLCSSRVRE
jgi:hypothetical protein